MKHRQLILSSVLLIVILIAINKFSPKKTADPGVLVPVELRCDGAVNPLCGSSAPILTWQLSSSVRGERPTAWQVRVATSEKILASDATDLWDSGKVGVGNEVMEETLVSRVDKIPGLRYEGQALKAGTRAHWQVRWWNAEDQVSPWSQIATWEVAPSSVADWQGARWMDDGKPVPTQDEDFYKPDPAPLMRHEFTVSKPIAKARLHFAGLGLGLANVNGSPVSDQVFDPAWTNFDKRILFRTHDVTDHLKEGENCLALMLGNGWYNPLPLKMWGNRNIRDSLPLGRPRAIALLVIDHPDGTTTTVKSGEGWKMAEGPTVRNSIYLGEERDARLDPVGWDLPEFDDMSWKPVHLTDHPLEPLMPLKMQPVRKQEPISAKAITTPQPGVHIVDFGVNFTGVPEIAINVPAGTKIVVRFGELLHEDGTLNFLTSTAGQIKGLKKDAQGNMVPKGGPGSPEFAWQQNVYIARGGGTEVFVPRFTFHGFRYMEISGLPETPKTENFRAFPLHTDVPSVGSFSCSNDDLNRIQEITRRTFLSNIMTVQSDCPHRERFGYGGDIVATSEAFMMNFDMAGFYAKTVRDWGDAVRPDGRLTDTAPFVGIDYCGVGWAMVHPLLLEQLYRYYGDRALIEEQLPVAIRWIDVVAAQRQDGLIVKGLGDHEALIPARSPAHLTPKFIDSARRIARLSRIIGKEEDATRFDQMANESEAAWAKAFLDPATGKVADGAQSTQAFALGFGAVPEVSRKAVFDQLVGGLTAVEDSPRLTTGIYGTWIMLEQLSKYGRSDLAYGLANRETFPSWKWMIKNGATSLWEHWEQEQNTYSHSHPMFGSISTWYFRWLGGIQCADDAVGFDYIMLRPQIPAGLDWVKTSHQSLRGEIVSNWSINGKERVFEFTIPVGTTAIAEIPARAEEILTEGGKALSQSPEIKLLESTPSIHRIELGSGTYRFETKAK
ncbi:MAG: family 78 glycoside hydrolase catalytic domain [Akkermansiaceae bacterium]|jgi:alpha-L-rhamnosidase|nr:glycoside hydrolase family 78 protein [Luteolibacter sp.]